MPSTSTSSSDEVPRHDSGSITVAHNPTASRTRRRHEQQSNAPPRLSESVWYRPNAIPLYDKLHSIELHINEAPEPIRSRFIAYTLPIRIYYAILFHLRILLARRDADVADEGELLIIKEFDSCYHIDSLPIHAEMVDLFRLTFPARKQGRRRFQIAPERPNFATFKLKDRASQVELDSCDIPSLHHVQPNPCLGIRLLRWFQWKKDLGNENDLPDQMTRLNFMALDRHNPRINYSRSDSPTPTTALKLLFTNPLFKHFHPDGNPFDLRSLDHFYPTGLPEATSEISPDLDFHAQCRRILQLSGTSTWFNLLKYVVSTTCYYSGQVELMYEVNYPYSSDEIEASLRFIKTSEIDDAPRNYGDFANWMTPTDETTVEGPAPEQPSAPANHNGSNQ